MSKMLKIMLAQCSYFLEKHIGEDAVIWSILFVGICCAAIFAAAVKIIERILQEEQRKQDSKRVIKNLFPVYIGVSAILTYMINQLMLHAYTWNSKLIRVMSNFNYVLSFDSNRKAFLKALSLPDNTYNQEHLFKIAMYLNDSQWEKVTNALGSGGWYFQKIQMAVTNILRVGDTDLSPHLSLAVLYQNATAYIPLLLTCLMGIYLLMCKKDTISGVMLLVISFVSVLFTMGAGIFFCVMIFAGAVFYTWTQKTESQIMRLVQKREKEKTEEADKDR